MWHKPQPVHETGSTPHYNVPDAYVEADFFYKAKDRKSICVMCHGKAHDQPAQRENDEENRAVLEDLGYEVVVIHWRDDLDRRPLHGRGCATIFVCNNGSREKRRAFTPLPTYM